MARGLRRLRARLRRPKQLPPVGLSRRAASPDRLPPPQRAGAFGPPGTAARRGGRRRWGRVWPQGRRRDGAVRGAAAEHLAGGARRPPGAWARVRADASSCLMQPATPCLALALLNCHRPGMQARGGAAAHRGGGGPPNTPAAVRGAGAAAYASRSEAVDDFRCAPPTILALHLLRDSMTPPHSLTAAGLAGHGGGLIAACAIAAVLAPQNGAKAGVVCPPLLCDWILKLLALTAPWTVLTERVFACCRRACPSPAPSFCRRLRRSSWMRCGAPRQVPPSHRTNSLAR